MNDNITTITDRGQVSIPAELRRELSLSKGRRLLWERLSNREIRVTVVEDLRPAGASSVLGFARRFRVEPRSTRSWMDELRSGES
jgi:AbrB family looped-hinge helix DNA binding protein